MKVLMNRSDGGLTMFGRRTKTTNSSVISNLSRLIKVISKQRRLQAVKEVEENGGSSRGVR